MSLDQNESVDRTLEEILAELGLLDDTDKPAPEASASGEPVSAEPVLEEPAPETIVSEMAASAASAPEASASAEEISHSEPDIEIPKPVTVSTEAVRAAVEEVPAEEIPAEEMEEEIPEPSTMVFSPSRLREQMKAVAVAASAPKVKAAPPSSASLKAELEQLSRSGGGHTVTEKLRAQDPPVETEPRKKAAVRRESAVRREPVKVESAKEIRWKRELFEWIKAMLIALGAAFIIFFVLIRIVNVEGASMQPALEPGDRLVISGLFYDPEPGDIVVTSAKNGLNKPLVKRVIALGGQTVDLNEEGQILINGLPIDEDYLNDKKAVSPGDLTFPLTVPEGSVFLLGDNREISVDSRSEAVGMIGEKELKGKVLLRFWPMERFGSVK